MANCANLPCSSRIDTGVSGPAFKIINNSVYGSAISGEGSNVGVVANGESNGLFSLSPDNIGIIGMSFNGTGIIGQTNSTASLAKAIHGQILSTSPGAASAAVRGENRGTGGYGIGVWGSQNGSGWGVYGSVASSSGYAGYFNGRVYVSGFLSKGGGGFRIDHPSDPANKYLNHSFVESSEMKNLYDGVVTLDKNGEALIELPEWFEALNQDFRYQLTCIGEYAPVYVAQKIEKSRLRNSFKIAGGIAGMEVSWQVTGVRHDRWAQANSMTVEEEKSDNQRGYYLHPEVYGQSEEMSIEWADNPEVMRQMKEERENPPSIDIPEL
ncbi:MAG: hypothetical protein QNJ34_16630 [Xenococcaceae cyanobacterium MO_188.B29]|nr:hypothetical protein [Xenococcaceae cyanobacterium MO_188.B29]